MAIYDLTDKNYSKIVESIRTPIFIDFYSPMCGPCLELMPLLDRLDKYYNSKVLIARVDVTNNPKIATKYQIESVPFCIVIGEDKMVKKAEIGLRSSEVYFKMIDRVLGRNKSFFAKLFG